MGSNPERPSPLDDFVLTPEYRGDAAVGGSGANDVRRGVPAVPRTVLGACDAFARDIRGGGNRSVSPTTSGTSSSFLWVTCEYQWVDAICISVPLCACVLPTASLITRRKEFSQSSARRRTRRRRDVH
jgi:hypothetical protein